MHSGASFSLCLGRAAGVDTVEILEALVSAVGVTDISQDVPTPSTQAHDTSETDNETEETLAEPSPLPEVAYEENGTGDLPEITDDDGEGESVDDSEGSAMEATGEPLPEVAEPDEEGKVLSDSMVPLVGDSLVKDEGEDSMNAE